MEYAGQCVIVELYPSSFGTIGNLAIWEAEQELQIPVAMLAGLDVENHTAFEVTNYHTCIT